jgi:hypothetical protein
LGNLTHPGGPLTSANESFAEYLALQTVRRFHGDSAFRARLSGYALGWRNDTTSLALSDIGNATAFHDRYRYEYLPALLVGLEEIVGAKAMHAFVGQLIKEPPKQLTYAELREAALRGGITTAQWNQFDEQCIRARGLKSCVAKWVNP